MRDEVLANGSIRVKTTCLNGVSALRKNCAKRACNAQLPGVNTAAKLGNRKTACYVQCANVVHSATYTKQQTVDLIEAIKNSDRPKHPFIKEAMQTRGIILEEYAAIAKELYKMGHKTEAKIISTLAKEVAGQDFKTAAQAAFDSTVGKPMSVAPRQENEK